MSVTQAAHSLFQSAAAVLATPSAQLSGFSLAGIDPAKAAQPNAAQPARHLHDRTHAALLGLQQEAGQAGALAGDLGALIPGAG
ncbi:MAG: hypothetical protein BGP12_19250 [Rhodospirillales bacterium 70-18]|nr:hypothetical protein [Rhodospirillales bacterium]OJY65330.1 MAG: hypothetical protein BGP12_19250 [Rhodospirillales bacterium 70-18]